MTVLLNITARRIEDGSELTRRAIEPKDAARLIEAMVVMVESSEGARTRRGKVTSMTTSAELEALDKHFDEVVTRTGTVSDAPPKDDIFVIKDTYVFEERARSYPANVDTDTVSDAPPVDNPDGTVTAPIDVVDVVERQPGIRLKDFKGVAPGLTGGRSPDEFLAAIRGEGIQREHPVVLDGYPASHFDNASVCGAHDVDRKHRCKAIRGHRGMHAWRAVLAAP